MDLSARFDTVLDLIDIAIGITEQEQQVSMTTIESPLWVPSGFNQQRDGGLRENDRFATDKELKEHLEELASKEHLEQLKVLYGATPGETVSAALQIALGQCGTKETPPGSNHTPYNDWYAVWAGNSYFKACAWCAIFQSWVGANGGHTDGSGDIPPAYRSAGAWALVTGLAHAGHGLSKPQPGALVAYNWGSGHVELCIKPDPDPSYYFTVGGNTGDGNPQEGDGVYYIRRYFPGQLYSIPFALPFYATTPPPNKNPFAPHNLVQVKGQDPVWEMFLDGQGLYRAHVPNPTVLQQREAALGQTVYVTTAASTLQSIRQKLWPL